MNIQKGEQENKSMLCIELLAIKTVKQERYRKTAKNIARLNNTIVDVAICTGCGAQKYLHLVTVL